MKIFNMLFVLTICFLSSCTEVTNPSNIDDIEEYMPMAIGNYWVYEVYDSLQNKSYIDSMAVVSDTTILNKKMYIVHNFRNGSIHDTGYYYVSDNSIALYGKVLMPMLWTPDDRCFSTQTKKIFSILDTREKWSCRDSVYGVIYPLTTHFAFTLIITVKRYESKNAHFNDSTYKSIDVELKGTRTYYEIYDSKYIFSTLSNKLYLKLKFAKGIGIMYSYESAIYEWEHCQTRKLLRYKVE